MFSWVEKKIHITISREELLDMLFKMREKRDDALPGDNTAFYTQLLDGVMFVFHYDQTEEE